MTKYGAKILNIIDNSCEHLTAEQIYLRLKSSEPNIVLASVYNNLKALYDSGLIRKIETAGAADRYDKNVKHDHLVCKKCGKLADFRFDDLTDKIADRLSADILGYDLKIYYVCEDCKKRAAD